MTSPENSEIELELTYLASQIPEEIRGVEPKHLLDIYIPEDPDTHSHLRLRQKGDSYETTKKVLLDAGDASEQMEYTIPLDAEEFEALSSVSDKRIEKDRYNVDIDGHPAEVDVFLGALKGLVLIDFEFSNPEGKQSFIPPACCLEEVTQEDFIAGGNLAGKSYADIADDLARFNYKPLHK